MQYKKQQNNKQQDSLEREPRIDLLEIEEAKQQASMLDHLTELRKRVLFSLSFFVPTFILSYSFSDHILSFLVKPLLNAKAFQGGHGIIYTQMTEAFSTYISISMLGALALSFPVFAYNAWKFFAPGLYRNEKVWVVLIMTISPLLFLLGGVFAYVFIIPLAWNFFANFQSEQLILTPKISEYVSLITQFIVAFGISFQLPVVIVILGRINMISVETLKNNRKIALLAIMTVSAFLTPPDVLSMLGLTFPIYALYEISILVLNLLIKRDNQKQH